MSISEIWDEVRNLYTDDLTRDRLINGIGAALGTAMVPIHYTAQFLTTIGQTNRSFISDNLGDYGAALAMVSLGNMISTYNGDESVAGSLLDSLYVAAGWTAFEIGQKYHMWPGTYQTEDILAFWGGSATAFALGRLSASQRVRSFIDKF